MVPGLDFRAGRPSISGWTESSDLDLDRLAAMLSGLDCPGEEFSILLGASHRFYEDGRSTEGSGWIRFENASGEPRREFFTLSGEHERRAMVHNQEEPKTLYELQKIPEKLDAVAGELEELQQLPIPAGTVASRRTKPLQPPGKLGCSAASASRRLSGEPSPHAVGARIPT